MLTWMEYPTGTWVFKTRVPSSADPDLLLLVSPFRPNPFPRRARRSLSLQLHRLSLQPLPRFTNAHLYDVPFACHCHHRRSGQRILRRHQQSLIFFRSSFLQVFFFFFFFFWSKSYFPSLLILFSFSPFPSSNLLLWNSSLWNSSSTWLNCSIAVVELKFESLNFWNWSQVFKTRDASP